MWIRTSEHEENGALGGISNNPSAILDAFIIIIYESVRIHSKATIGNSVQRKSLEQPKNETKEKYFNKIVHFSRQR